MQMTPTEWIAAHRALGHHPHPAPTKENPEQWECKCDPDAVWTAVWRILTPRQVRQKFAHLGAIAKKKTPEAAEEEQRRLRAKLWGQGVAHDRTDGAASSCRWPSAP